MKPTNNSPDVLNRLLAIHYRSLPMYLVWACPYRRPQDEQAWKVVHQIVDDQKATAARIVELIQDRNQRVAYGDFPITFTGSHDLAMSYLVRRLSEWQRGTVAAIQQCYDALANDPIAQALADESLGAARGHLETLEELRAGKLPSSDANPPSVKLHEPEVAAQH